MTRALFIVDDPERANEDEVLREFVARAGGVDALILVCGLASGDAAAIEAEYIDRFTGFGARATHLHADAPSDQASDQLDSATAVWLTGGDGSTGSDELSELLGDELRRRNDDGLLIGGTSEALRVVRAG